MLTIIFNPGNQSAPAPRPLYGPGDIYREDKLLSQRHLAAQNLAIVLAIDALVASGDLK